MNNKILVTYASRSGSTAGVAEAIGRVLADAGAEVDVLPMLEVTDLALYRAVVAGSAIRDRKWLPEAMQFVRTHRAALARRPFAAFMVCITLAMAEAEKYRAGVSEWMQPVRTLVPPLSEGLFAGRLDFEHLPVNFKTLQLRATVALGIFPPGDHRDWEAIRAWAADLAPRLLA